MADTQYSVIREQGEFMEPKELTPDENKAVNEQQKSEDKNK